MPKMLLFKCLLLFVLLATVIYLQTSIGDDSNTGVLSIFSTDAPSH